MSSTIPNWLYTFRYLETLVHSKNNFHGEISSSIGNLKALVNLDIYIYIYIYISDNQLDGKVPNSLGNLCKLMVLDLSKNNFSGSVSEYLKACLGRMVLLALSDNNLSGHLSYQLGNFKNLRLLDFSSNLISEGVVSEVHFTNLTRLRDFYASENLLTLKTSSDWLPPFQLSTLFLNSWHLESSELPAWLQTQTQLLALNMSNTTILGTIPTWF
ncbi:hypothetical protein DVH24_012150 [Malus domestica]|uniref:Leucine-rich repeat-containing N-terminal plant-type domain-containing protein n=1 Tax=Malus domestica TaxID=3750 RepID=A0A498HLX0_MALDO|nr:hypothetical protein DVH24_012150 [Malus domestica]